MKIKKIKVFLLLLIVFVSFFVYPNMKSFASDGETEGEEVIYLTSTSDELFGDGIDLTSKVFDNSKVKKIVLPQNAKYILSDYRYESDKAIVQNYESITPNCPNLEQIEVEPENPYFTVVDGILYSKDLKVLYYCPPAKKGAVVFPEEVEVIQYLAFQECNQITSITFSTSLKTVYQGAFGGNNKLVTLKVSGDNPNFSVKSNVLFSKAGDVLYLYPAGMKDANYDVPYGVRRINPGAFLGNQYIKSIDIPETVSSIGIESFKNCRNLIKVKLREGLLDIEAGAFLNCSKLSELTFPDGLLNVYEAAISGCNSLLAIRLPESIQTAPQRLNEVKNRTIHCYSLYNASWVIHDPIVENNTIAYAYKGSKVADYVKKKGVTVKYYDLKVNEMSDIMAELLKAKYIAVGSSTLNNQMLPNVAAFLCYLKGLAPKNKKAFAFGSYGWSGQSIPYVNEELKACGLEIILDPFPVSIQLPIIITNH